MCVSQCWWMGCSPAPPLLLLLLPLWLLPLPLWLLPLVQAEIIIPKDYEVHNMSQPPVLTDTPYSFTAFSLDDIKLPCEATGSPMPIFRWVKDGEQFGAAQTGSGTIEASGYRELGSYEGFYRCFVSNKLGTAVTQTVQVIVEPQPVLQKQQKLRRQAYEGDSIVLSCSPPHSSTPPTIHWMDKNMVHVSRSARVLIGLDGKLYFANLLKSDSRDDYVCNAQYYAARTILPETAVRLTVLPSNDVIHGKKPHLLQPSGHHSTVTTLRGESLTLECIPRGLPTPIVTWKKKDSSIQETSGEQENYGRWLTFRSITQQDDGEYECEATNTHGAAIHSFTVTVEAAPYWRQEPQNLLYSPGETVRLDCVAEGIPTPTVTWSINGQPITEVDPEPRRSVVGGVLKLMDVEFEDTAVYQCEASNKHGSILLNTYVYVIELPPQILSPDGFTYEVVEGQDVTMDCVSFGSPRPHVTWEDENMMSDPRVSLLTNGSMKLSDVTHQDRGTYTCSISAANISISTRLDIYNRTVMVAPPQDLRVQRGSSALLHCGFYKDPQLLQQQVIWRRNTHKLQELPEDDKYTFFNDGTMKVTDVQPDDTARYSCEVVTKLDNVRAEGSITVVDRPDPPKDLSLSDLEDQSLTLSWIPGQSHNSPITEFVVEGREEQHTEEGQWKWEEWTRVPGDVNHRQLTLRPFCTYRFRVVAANAINFSDPSHASHSHSTPPAVPSMNPVGVHTQSVDPKTLTITWDEMDKRSHNGPDFLYQVWWREAGRQNAQWNQRFVKAPPFVANDTETYSPFEIKVQAVNALGEATPPEPVIGHSGEDNPEDAPSTVETLVMNSTIRVMWQEAQKVRGVLMGHKIYLRRLGPQGGRGRRSLGKPHGDDRERRSDRGRDPEATSKVVTVHGTKTSAEVTGLQLFSRYQLTLTAFNSKGEGPHSPVHLFNTPEGAPGPPALLRLDSPTETSVVLHWTAPLETNGVLHGYTVQYQEEVDSTNSLLQMEFISDPSVTHIRLDGLDPGRHYTFKVIACTASADGPPIVLRGATMLNGVPPSNISIVPDNTLLNLSWTPGERERNHGFTIRYLRKSEGAEWEESELVNSTQGFYSLTGLQPGTEYHLIIAHGNLTQWEGAASTIGSVSTVMPGGFATQGWLIGLISAIVLLILILLILCLIKRSRGGKYAVKDKEDKEVDSEARPMKDETFGEYRSLESDGEEKRSDSQQSLCVDSKLGSDDSLAEYGDSVDIQFNEDGSFIGQYSGRGPTPHGNHSSGPASPDVAAPPPPIAPSMSSILNRPS